MSAHTVVYASRTGCRLLYLTLCWALPTAVFSNAQGVSQHRPLDAGSPTEPSERAPQDSKCVKIATSSGFKIENQKWVLIAILHMGSVKFYGLGSCAEAGAGQPPCPWQLHVPGITLLPSPFLCPLRSQRQGFPGQREKPWPVVYHSTTPISTSREKN